MSDNSATLVAATEKRARPSAAGLARSALLASSFAVIGILFAVLVMGPHTMDPQNISWMIMLPPS